METPTKTSKETYIACLNEASKILGEDEFIEPFIRRRDFTFFQMALSFKDNEDILNKHKDMYCMTDLLEDMGEAFYDVVEKCFTRFNISEEEAGRLSDLYDKDPGVVEDRRTIFSAFYKVCKPGISNADVREEEWTKFEKEGFQHWAVRAGQLKLEIISECERLKSAPSLKDPAILVTNVATSLPSPSSSAKAPTASSDKSTDAKVIRAPKISKETYIACMKEVSKALETFSEKFIEEREQMVEILEYQFASDEENVDKIKEKAKRKELEELLWAIDVLNDLVEELGQIVEKCHKDFEISQYEAEELEKMYEKDAEVMNETRIIHAIFFKACRPELSIPTTEQEWKLFEEKGGFGQWNDRADQLKREVGEDFES